MELAFSGAVGHGRFSSGGRGGTIIVVNSLNDSGSGTLRAALEAAGPRIVVFRVAGTITLSGPIAIRNPFITIAGQTAPGGGICIKNGYLKIQTHDVIIRGLRIRPGDGTPNSDAQKGLELTGVDNVIIDHCSISWSRDQLINAWNSYDRVTISNCILAEPFETAPPGGTGGKEAIGRGIAIGAGDDPNAIHGGFTVFQTLIAHSLGRNPRPRDGGMEFINCIVYDWKTMGGQTDGDCRFDVIGSHYLRGPESVTASLSTRNEVPTLRVYLADNQLDIPHSIAPEYLSTERLHSSGLTPLPASVGYENVLTRSGAVPRDAVDSRIVADVRNSTGGLIDSQDEVGGWPVLAGTPPIDSDGDGIPDGVTDVEDWMESFFRDEVPPGADCQAEYDRGYSEGEAAGYVRGYEEGDAAGYVRGLAEGEAKALQGFDTLVPDPANTWAKDTVLVRKK